MRAIRSIITRLVLLVSVLITGASLWLASQQDVPVTVDHRQLALFELLVNTDVEQASADERSRLMRRLDRAFRLGADWREPLLELDESAWSQFRENLFALLHDWLIDRANTYHELGQGGHRAQWRQERFVEQQTATVTAWIAAAADAEPSATRTQQQRSFQIGVELFSRLQRWSAEAEGEQQARITAFTQAMLE